MKSNTELLVLDYFTGGVPAGLILSLDVNQLRELVKNSNTKDSDPKKTAEVCFIGLLAYFEAFFKNNFAALVNVCPELIDNLKKSGIDVCINADDLLKIGKHSQHKIGFLLSERYDFGSAKKINSIYMGSLNLSPFSKKEIKNYDRLLSDRNLIVHHGGIFTMRYSDQIFEKKYFEKILFMDSLVIGTEYFLNAADFVKKIAIKTVQASRSALQEFINSGGINLTAKQKKALSYIGYFDLD